MSKALRKAIVTRSRLENKFHRKRSEDRKGAFKKQKNIVVDCIKRKERNFIVI